MNAGTVDVAVIGAGTAGMAAWRAAHAAGKRVVLIERGAAGTTCARVGCMPSKLLLAAAHGLYDARRLAARGIAGTDGLRAESAAVMRVVRRERDRFVQSVLDELASLPRDALIYNNARFERRADTHQRLVMRDETGAERRLDAHTVVIATGARPSVPDAFRVFGEHLLTSDAVFEMRTLPRRMAVFGAGPVALELGQGLSRLGADVFMFGRDNAVGGIDDPRVRDALSQCLADEFHFDPDARIDDMSMRDGKPSIVFRTHDGQARREQFDTVLAATGRAPDLAALGLEHAGIELDDHGTPCFDAHTMQCGVSNVFIAGDCDGARPWLSDAADEGRIAGENAARYPDVERVERKTPLSLIFCDPQVALVGARYTSLDPRENVTGSVGFAAQGRSRINGKARGQLNVYAAAKDGRLLGAQMCGPDAEHLGHLLAWAVQLGLTLDDMLRLPFYHPVVEEGLRSALAHANEQCYASRGETAQTQSVCVGA